jgi:hypothetical protein
MVGFSTGSVFAAEEDAGEAALALTGKRTYAWLSSRGERLQSLDSD